MSQSADVVGEDVETNESNEVSLQDGIHSSLNRFNKENCSAREFGKIASDALNRCSKSYVRMLLNNSAIFYSQSSENRSRVFSSSGQNIEERRNN